MPPRTSVLLEPRKTPVQTRSAASVDAILEATIQVLLATRQMANTERLTTTRVARRAGVSVGTLYQYFPNKRALLRAALQRHLDHVIGAVETVCAEQRGNTLPNMAAALVTAFLHAKMRDPKTSVALYSVSSDLDGVKMLKQMEHRANNAIVAMLSSARQPLAKDPALVASMLQGVMSGVSRRLLESAAPEQQFEPMRDELILFVSAYMKAAAVAGSGS